MFFFIDRFYLQLKNYFFEAIYLQYFYLHFFFTQIGKNVENIAIIIIIN